jgi:hypothetical protein
MKITDLEDYAKLDVRFDRIENRIDSRFNQLEAKINRLEAMIWVPVAAAVAQVLIVFLK